MFGELVISTPEQQKADASSHKTFCLFAIAIFLFASWTVAFHFCILAHLSWQCLKYGYLACLPFLLFFIRKIGLQLSRLYGNEISRIENSTLFIVDKLLFLAAALLLFTMCWPELYIYPEAMTRRASLLPYIMLYVTNYNYMQHWLSTITIMLVLWCLRSFIISPSITKEDATEAFILSEQKAQLLLLIPVAISIIVILFFHHYANDDCFYLQLASTTLQHPHLPVFSFDYSFGTYLAKFTFTPNLLASYELFSALISSITGLDLLVVYFICLPVISGALTVVTAYLFSRWFLSSGTAIFAIVLFLLICFSWVGQSRSYGSFLFLHLFEGKSLLIAIATPAIILSGLLAMRRPCWQSYLLFLASLISALGMSSSGLLICIMAGALAIITGISALNREMLSRALINSTALLYPVTAGLLLRFASTINPVYLSIAVDGDINTVLDPGIKECLAFTILTMAAASLGLKRNPKVLFTLSLLTVAAVFNPFLSTYLATFIQGDIKWRLAWAGPIPLLMAITLSGLIASSIQQKKRFTVFILSLILVAFLFSDSGSGRWTLNYYRTGFSVPSVKVSINPSYFATVGIMSRIKCVIDKPLILATNSIAMWIPLASPGTEIIMPGHSFPAALETILDPIEYGERMFLYRMINPNIHLFHPFEPVTLKEPAVTSKYIEYVRKYKINVIIISKGTKGTPDQEAMISQKQCIDLLNKSGMHFQKLFAYDDYVVYSSKAIQPAPIDD